MRIESENLKFFFKFQYELPLRLRKCLIYIIGELWLHDKTYSTYEMDINPRKFCVFCGLDEPGQSDKQQLVIAKEVLQELADKSVWVADKSGMRQSLIRWIEEINIIEFTETPIIQVHFVEDILALYRAFGNNFSKYELSAILKMRSRYSLRLYETLKRRIDTSTTLEILNRDDNELKRRVRTVRPHTVTMSLEHLKTKMGAEHYQLYADFRIKALDIAVKEISRLTDLTLTYEPIKNGRKVSKIMFYCKTKPVKELTEMWMETAIKLGVAGAKEKTLKTGKLTYDGGDSRYYLDVDGEKKLYAVCSGDWIEIEKLEKWYPTQIVESGIGRWYTVDVSCTKLEGVKARMYV